MMDGFRHKFKLYEHTYFFRRSWAAPRQYWQPIAEHNLTMRDKCLEDQQLPAGDCRALSNHLRRSLESLAYCTQTDAREVSRAIPQSPSIAHLSSTFHIPERKAPIFASSLSRLYPVLHDHQLPPEGVETHRVFKEHPDYAIDFAYRYFARWAEHGGEQSVLQGR